MTDGPINQGGQGAAVECCLRHVAVQRGVARGYAATIAKVRTVRTSSIPIPGRSNPFESAGRSLRGYGADYAQAPYGNRTSATGVRGKQWANHRRDCDTRIGGVSEHSEKACLSRARHTARFKFTLTIYLIACTNRSSPRHTVFLCPLGNAPSAAV